jgi:hypothetical protein
MKAVIPPERLAWAKMSTKEKNDYRRWSGGVHSTAGVRPATADRPSAPRSWWRRIFS